MTRAMLILWVGIFLVGLLVVRWVWSWITV